MAEKDDLRLSLSLSTSESRFPLKLTLFPSKIPQCIYSDEEEAGAWSPVSTLSCLNGKRCDREQNEGEEDGQNSPKKLRLSKDQTAVLEESFEENSTLNPKQKQALANRLSLRPRQVEVWFQNRRARTKLKQTEVECEHLKSWCEKLAAENKRLQNEIMELRSTVNRVSSSPVATNNSTLSSPLQLLPSQQQYHVNLSAAVSSDPGPFIFIKPLDRYHSSNDSN